MSSYHIIISYHHIISSNHSIISYHHITAHSISDKMRHIPKMGRHERYRIISGQLLHIISSCIHGMGPRPRKLIYKYDSVYIFSYISRYGGPLYNSRSTALVAYINLSESQSVFLKTRRSPNQIGISMRFASKFNKFTGIRLQSSKCSFQVHPTGEGYN